MDREFEKLGYDIESRVPGTGRLRFIEVKGRVANASTITVTKNGILYSLNKPDDFILAIAGGTIPASSWTDSNRFGGGHYPVYGRQSMNKSMPDLREIRHPRHPGVTRAVCESFAEAAEVCLARHHEPPETLLTVDCDGSEVNLALQWRAPDGTAKRAWSNRDDATRDGAYIVSLATVESELGLVALSRAETRTGADYYVGNPESPDLESAYRLEVSGVDSGTGSTVRARLREKVLQAAKGRSNLPAYASVVGFREALVMVEEVR